MKEDFKNYSGLGKWCALDVLLIMWLMVSKLVYFFLRPLTVTPTSSAVNFTWKLLLTYLMSVISWISVQPYDTDNYWVVITLDFFLPFWRGVFPDQRQSFLVSPEVPFWFIPPLASAWIYHQFFYQGTFSYPVLSFEVGAGFKTSSDNHLFHCCQS